MLMTDGDPRLDVLRPWVERQQGRQYDDGPLDGEDCPDDDDCTSLRHPIKPGRWWLDYHDRAHLLDLVFGDGGKIMCLRESDNPWVWVLVDSGITDPDDPALSAVIQAAQDHRGDRFGPVYHEHDKDCDEDCDGEDRPFPAVEHDISGVVILEIDTAEALLRAAGWAKTRKEGK